jgi:hypothetical protein
MYTPTIQQFPYLAPVGTFPPATVGWLTNYVTVPTGFAEFVVPWQPGTPPGVLIPITWAVTDIFFRLENPSTSGSNFVQITRSITTGPFVVNNDINLPITIPAGANEAAGRPWTTATINMPLVNSGDKLQSVIGLGVGASVVTLMVTLVQQPIL